VPAADTIGYGTSLAAPEQGFDGRPRAANWRFKRLKMSRTINRVALPRGLFAVIVAVVVIWALGQVSTSGRYC